MKKVLFILAILFLSLTSVKGQTNVYHPFPTHDAIWRGYSAAWVTHVFYAYEYIIAGDTIITDNVYHKLNILKAGYPLDNTGGPILDSLGSASNQSYFGAFREDTALKKVYFKPNWNPNEFLLYDFSLQLNDSITSFSSPVSHAYVMTVDSVLIGTEYRRRLGIGQDLFSNNPYVYLIEGIGSTSDFYFAYDIPFEGCQVLYCFTQDGIHLYQSSEMNSTCDFLSVKENHSNKSFSISPNPFTTTTLITLPQTYHNIALEVYDIQGKLLMQQHYADSDKIQLMRHGLKNGMYFLKLTLDDRWVETGKVVVRE